MHQNSIARKIALSVIVALGLTASSAFACTQEAYLWYDYNPFNGANEPGYYIYKVWNDDEVGPAQYYFWGEGDYWAYMYEMYGYEETHSF